MCSRTPLHHSSWLVSQMLLFPIKNLIEIIKSELQTFGCTKIEVHLTLLWQSPELKSRDRLSRWGQAFQENLIKYIWSGALYFHSTVWSYVYLKTVFQRCFSGIWWGIFILITILSNQGKGWKHFRARGLNRYMQPWMQIKSFTAVMESKLSWPVCCHY